MTDLGVPSDSGYVITPEEVAYEARGHENALFTAGRMIIGIYAFAVASLAFAYFYLRSANSEDLWRPHMMNAPTGIGTAIMACTVAATALVVWGLRQLRLGEVLNWTVSGWVGVLAGLLALALQCFELTDLPFSPGASGYASCVIGWAVLNIMLLVSGIYWTETLLARHARTRGVEREATRPALHVRSEFEGEDQYLDELTTLWRTQRSGRQYLVNVESSVYFWGFVAVVAVFFWVFIYVAV